MIRKAAVAGGFYPAGKKEIEEMVGKFLDDAKDMVAGGLKGIIAPHAGYVYSGTVAGYAYRQLKTLPRKKCTVFLLGPAHFVFTTASVGMFEQFQTPLGPVKVNQAVCKELLKNGIFDTSVAAHLPEHSLEVQLPFLQKTLADFEIVPILLGDVSPEALSEILQPYFGKDRHFFVFSSDLSHYQPYIIANKTDARSLKIVTELDTANEEKIDACGGICIKTAMRLAKNSDCKIRLLNYRNSGDTAGGKDAVVGYASLAITG